MVCVIPKSSPGAWAQSRLNNPLLRRFGSIPARAGLLSALISLLVGGLISAGVLGVLYFSLHSSLEQSLHSRLGSLVDSTSGVKSEQELLAAINETGAGIDLVGVADQQHQLKQVSSVAALQLPTDLFAQVPADGAAHRIEDVESGETSFHALAQRATVGGKEYVFLTGIETDKNQRLYLLVSLALAVIMPMVAALAGFLTYRSVRSSLRPVETMRAEVENISSSNLTRRVPVPATRDEISALGHTMNSMLARLETAQATQLRFLGDASHELRSPIATISGLAEISQITGEPISSDTVDTILAPEAARMQRLVDDLLASAQAQSVAAPREEVDLDDIVLTERHRLSTLAPQLTLGGRVQPVRVVGVPDALTRTLRNLTDNALRYCRSRLDLTVHREGQWAVITVEDDGAGVPDDMKDLVLTRFGRADGSRNRATGGAGLGLSIVSDIVHAHGGTVEVSDSALGGACFTVRLPLAE